MFNFLAHAGHKHEAATGDLTSIIICGTVTVVLIAAVAIYLLATRQKTKK